jgi:hypothetical protein
METISGTVRLWTIRTCLDLYYSTHYCHTLRCNKPDMEIYKSIHINRSLNISERNRFTTQISGTYVELILGGSIMKPSISH